MSKHRVTARHITEAHHAVGFASIEEIDWHLRNLWDGGFMTLLEVPKEQHHEHHARKRRKYQEANRYLAKTQMRRLFGASATA